jgi:NADH:ubiquinone reductase (H+-translocating)
MNQARVVIIGGGFAGINVTKALNKAHVDILLIDKKNHHLFQPLLYQVASAVLSPADIATPLRQIFSHQKNTSVIMGTVKNIDKQNRELTLATGDTISYDYLVIAPGTSHSYFGNDQWASIAPGIKTLTDAQKIREKILLSFEKAERIDNKQVAEKLLNFVIIGAGPTGIEMAGAIAEMAHKTLFKDFRHIHPEKSKIYLIDAAPRILPSFPEKLSKRAHKDLEKMGVHIITGETVSNITEEGVEIGEDFIETCNILWAAGNQASPLLKSLDIPLDRQGRAIVKPDLSIPEHPEIFVIGDAASCKGKDGKPLAGIAPVAIQQGLYVGNIIRKHLSKTQRPPFVYFDKGSMATIGKNHAVGYIRNFRFGGFFAWIVWCFIHILYLVNYRSRISVMLQWIFYYCSNRRSSRLIYKSIDEELTSFRKKEKKK